MRSLTTTIIFLVLVSLRVSAQNEQKAIQILDKFADNALKAPSIAMTFNLVNENKTDNSVDTLAGTVVLSKDKYKLILPDNTIWFNGETSWSYLPTEQEVTITKANKKDNSFQNKPSLIFTLYKKDYKCRLIEEKTDSYLIDLYPQDLKSDIVRIRLNIGKASLNLISLEYKRRDGIISTLHVSEFDLTQTPATDVFIFPAAKYKDAEVVDMR
jgi:outer membrane lipoprotein carrier protein